LKYGKRALASTSRLESIELTTVVSFRSIASRKSSRAFNVIVVDFNSMNDRSLEQFVKAIAESEPFGHQIFVFKSCE
jgi:hypothetical protein